MTHNIYRPRKELEQQLAWMAAVGSVWRRAQWAIHDWIQIFSCNDTEVWLSKGYGRSKGPDLTGSSPLLDEITAYVRELRNGDIEGGRFFVSRVGVESCINGRDCVPIIRFVTNKKLATRKLKPRLERNAFLAAALAPRCPRCFANYDGKRCSACRFTQGGDCA